VLFIICIILMIQRKIKLSEFCSYFTLSNNLESTSSSFDCMISKISENEKKLKLFLKSSNWHYNRIVSLISYKYCLIWVTTNLCFKEYSFTENLHFLFIEFFKKCIVLIWKIRWLNLKKKSPHLFKYFTLVVM
jgi:hypothetical protein